MSSRLPGSDSPRFDSERAKAAAARLRYNEIRDALQEVNIRSVAADETFSVDMGVGGAILAVNLSAAALRRGPEELSEALLETINRGMKQVATLTNELVAPYLSSADLDLNAITSGRLPSSAAPPPKPDIAAEIEAASRLPKRPLGRYGRPAIPAIPAVPDDDGDEGAEGMDVTYRA